MRLLEWYLNCWSRPLGRVGAALAWLVLASCIAATAFFLVPWLWSIAWLSGPAILLLIAVAPLVVVMLIASFVSSLADPYVSGRRKARKEQALPSELGNGTERSYRAIRQLVRDQNTDVLVDIVASTGLGAVLALVSYGAIYWIFAYLTTGLQSFGIAVPNWLAMSVTGLCMLVCGIAALYGYQPLENIDQDRTLDRPYIPSQRQHIEALSQRALLATLLVEPFRLIASGILLFSEIRPAANSTMHAAAVALVSHAAQSTGRIEISPDVAGVLLRCRLIKSAVDGSTETYFVLTEKSKDLLGLPSVGSAGERFLLSSVNRRTDRVSSGHERHPRREIPEWKRY